MFSKLSKTHRNDPSWFPSDSEVEQAAIDQVRSMLVNPEQLGRIAFFRSDYEGHTKSVQSQIRSAVRQQMDETRQTREALAETVDAVKNIRESFSQIHDLCGLDSKLRKNPDIAKVNIVDINVNKTKNLKNGVEEIPESVRDAYKMLDEERFLDTYLEVRKLNKLRLSLQQKASEEVEQKVETEFASVEALGVSLLDKIVETLVDCFAFGGTGDEHILVEACEVVALEDAKTTSIKIFQNKIPQSGYLRDLILDKMSTSVGDTFIKLMRQPETNAKRKESKDEEVQEIHSKRLAWVFTQLNEHVEDLTKVKSVAPCFPPTFEIENFFITKYSIYIKQVIFSYSVDMSSMRQSDMLSTVNEIEKITKNMCNNFPGNSTVFQIKRVAPKMMQASMDAYVGAARKNIFPIIKNIVRVEDNEEQDDKQRYFTNGPTDLLFTVNSQVDLIVGSKLGAVGLRYVGRLIRDIFLEHQKAINELLSDVEPSDDGKLLFGPSKISKPDTFICAIINNCDECDKGIDDVRDKILDDIETRQVVDDEHESDPKTGDEDDQEDQSLEDYIYNTMDEASDGYLKVAKNGGKMLAFTICHEITPLLKTLFDSEWLADPEPFANMVYIIKDYFDDYKLWLSKDVIFGKVVVQKTLSTLVAEYLKALLTLKKLTLTSEFINRIQQDVDVISEVFSDYETIGYSLKLIEKELAGIKMIIQIAKAAEENISGHFQKFNLAFINKKEAKTRPMDVLKFIIYGRADIEPKDKDELLENFDATYPDPEAKIAPRAGMSTILSGTASASIALSEAAESVFELPANLVKFGGNNEEEKKSGGTTIPALSLFKRFRLGGALGKRSTNSKTAETEGNLLEDEEEEMTLDLDFTDSDISD